MLLGLRRSSPLAFCAKLTARREKAKLACHMTELEHISHNNVSGGSSGTNQHPNSIISSCTCGFVRCMI